MKRLLALATLLGLLGLATNLTGAPTADQKKAKDKLRELSEFIGGWKGSGAKKAQPGPRDKSWDETVNWGWRFKGDDAWLTVDFKGGGVFKDGELRYLPKSKNYELTVTPAEGKDKIVFTGEFDDNKLEVTGKEPKTNNILVLKMYLAGEGIRMIYRVDRKVSPRALARLDYQFAATKVGESLGRKEKGPECVVSGGRGTTPVSYMGETFYVCCSGCADAFKENPKKYIDEFKKKKKK